MRHTNPIHSGGQAGFGLIEVLIALMVLSVGMLGLAGLQMWSLKNNQSSMERAIAVMQTHTIADAMRADRTTAINNGFNLDIDEATGSISGGDALATEALTTWRNNLLANLGEQATGGVRCNGATCTIVVRWNDQHAAAASTEPRTQQLETVVRL